MERNFGNLDAARPLSGEMVAVDVIAADRLINEASDGKAVRNRHVGWLLAASNERCGLYLETLNESDRETNFLFTGLATVLGGLGAIFTPAGTARALSGAAGISAGVGTNWNNAAFLAKSMAIITQSIKASRAEMLSGIEGRFADDLTKWPWPAAAAAVQTYHDACSLPGAFAFLSVVVGKENVGRPANTAPTEAQIIQAQTRALSARRFQRECVEAAGADPASTRCKGLKAAAEIAGDKS